MSTGTWRRVGVAGLLAASLASCAHDRKPTAEATPAAQPTPPEVQAAPKRQDDVTEAQSRLEAAHQDVARAQQQLALARQREEQERANVQQLEIKARQDLDRASQLAYQAEQAQGLRTATGRVAQATPSRVILQFQDGRTMSFSVDDRTRVLVGSEQRSVSDIQQGADARVAYEPRGAEPTAITIRLAPLGSEMGVTPPSPARPSETEPPTLR
jgi:DNA polymerase III gamma/tau subunit